MARNRFFALLTVLCMLIGMVPVHAHASHADPLDALYHTRHQWDATHQIQADSRGKLLVRSADQAVLPAGDDEFLVSNTLEDNCRWGIADDGFLYIWCEGEMPTREVGQYPWSVYKELYNSLYADTTTVADNAFADCDNLSLVILEESVTAIGENAFAGCTGLEEFWFYGTAPTIADNAFAGTETHAIYHFNDASFAPITDRDFGGDLTWVTWVEAIDGGMFGTVEWTVYEDMSLSLRGTGSSMQDMSSAEGYPWSSWQDEITYVECAGLTRLGNYALADFTALTYAYFDQTLTAIGSGAFQGCAGMTLSFAGNAPTLGVDVFSCDDLFLEYPQDNPTWTAEVIDLFYGRESGENELPPENIPSEEDPPQNTACGMSAQQVYNAMIALKPQYPEGMHWTNDDYYAWNGGYFTGGYGCAGFAFILSDAAFGTEPCRLIEEDISIDDIRVGDILRINNDTHSVIVLEVHENHVVIAEGNFNSSIHWGRTLSADTIASTTDYIMTRYPEHSWSSGSCLEPRTCLNCGYAAEAPGHTWLVASCTAPRTCSVCGFSEGEPAGHTYTDDTDNSCNVCGFLRDVGQQPAVTIPLSAFELEVLRLTNLERLAAGLNPLTATEALQLATDIRADEVKAYFNHTRPNGTSCFTVLDELGIPYHAAAENIASGYQTPAAVVVGWMNSPGHRANILNASLGHMGVGEMDRAWVQLFTDAPAYTAIRVDVPENTLIQPGTEIDDLGLVAVLRNSNGDCWLPLASAFCTGYDPNAGGTQTVTVSVLGVTCSFTLTAEGHTHTWVEATCETPRTCSACGKAEGAPLGHNWQDATCEAPKTCSACSMTEGTALGHDWTTASCDTPGTCLRCGATTGGPLGHNWQAATCEAPKTCSACGKTDGSALGHDWTAASCEQPGICSRCGISTGEALGHSWDGGTVTLEPTPEADGLKTFTCQICGAVQTEPIPATLAPFVSIEKPDSIASRYGLSYEIPQDGATVLIFFSNQCGKSVRLMSALNECAWMANPWLNVVAVESNAGTEEATAEFRDAYTPDVADHIRYMYTNSNALLFDYFSLFSNENTLIWPLVLVITGSAENPVVRFGSDAMTDAAKLEEILGYVSPAFAGWDDAVHQHTWLDATCEAPKTCSECGITEGNALGHDWSAASCDAPGTCLRCGTTEGAPLGHNWIDATCQTPKTCSVCGKTEGSTTDHGWGSGIVTLEPTPEAEGLKTYTCQTCGTTRTESIPATLAPFVQVDKPDTVASQYSFTYEIPQDGATVLIFYANTCNKSQKLMSQLNECAWMANPWLNVVAVETCLGTEEAVEAFRNTYTPNVADHIRYMCASDAAIMADYYQLFSASPLLSWPLVVVITGSAENPVVRFGDDGMTDAAKLEEVLGYVSPAFAGWDGTIHQHTWVDATCQAPKTCSECGVTEGEPIGHSFQNGICAMCGLAELMQGDANGNGALDYDDALKVLRASISLETLPDEVALSCDVNGNGVLDFDDALLILRASIGLITEFPKAN